MKRPIGIFISLVLTTFLTLSASAQQQKIKIGILGQFSGPYAATGTKYRQGIDAFQAAYGAKIGGRDVEIVYRDVGGSNPSVAKQLVEELIVKEKVSLIGGFYLSPEPMAAAPVLTETKTPAVVFNGAALAITKTSPYIIRPANTQQMIGYVQAEWGHQEQQEARLYSRFRFLARL
jgi:branched-chain amino acid transport system substrate-binding protein